MDTYIKIKKYVKDLLVACGRKFSKEEALAEEQRQELIRNINIIKNEWEIAKNNFELANTKDGVDYYAYKIKAYEVRYQTLLKEAKKKGIRAPILCQRRVGIYSK